MIMSSEQGYANRKGQKKYHLLSLFIALLFALTIYPNKAHAQIIGELAANIPFQFHAGNTNLPPGKYVLRMLDDSDLTVMEISSADGSTSALVQVQDAEAASAPVKNELIFNRYGDRYFLSKVFDEGNPSGSKVIESRDEKKISQTAVEAEEQVPANYSTQHGK
jgi:hypothetical protein